MSMVMMRGAKVPGCRNYRAEPQGLADLAAGNEELESLCRATAEQVAELARQNDPRGEYSVSSTTAVAGWNHDRRPAAVVTQEKSGFPLQAAMLHTVQAINSGRVEVTS